MKAYNSVSIRPRVTGVLKEIHFIEGDDVQAGQLLFTIDPIPFEQALNQAVADLARDRATAAQARKDYARYKDLVEKKVVSRESYDEKETALATARNMVLADQATVEIARQNLSYTAVVSPINGRTGIRLMDEGNLVVANQDNLVVINQLEPVKVIFSLPENLLPEVRKYAAGNRLKVQAVINGDKNHPEWGVLSLIDNQVNPSTGMINLEAAFPNPDHRLWPGQFVIANLELTVQQDMVKVPSRAVVRGQQGFFVYVVDANNTVQVRPVTKGQRMDETQVLDSGVKAGETVVVDGQLNLYPGARIIPSSDPDAITGDDQALRPRDAPPQQGAPGTGKGSGTGTGNATDSAAN